MTMTPRQRERLLERVYQPSGSIGRSIPETVDCDGETIPVREPYFEFADQESLSGSDEERVHDLLSTLRRERLRLVQRLREDDVAFATGEALVETIHDIDRAINAYESLEDPSLSEQYRRDNIRSAQELVELMRAFGKK